MDSGGMLRIPGKCNNICKSILDVILSKILIPTKGKVKLPDWLRIFAVNTPGAGERTVTINEKGKGDKNKLCKKNRNFKNPLKQNPA